VTTVLGSFVACKITTNQVPSLIGAFSSTLWMTWIAAEGPYRGQILKAESRDSSGKLVYTHEALSITYAPK